MDKPFWTAVIETSDGTFTMNCNLPLERVKQIAEDLIPIE